MSEHKVDTLNPSSHLSRKIIYAFTIDGVAKDAEILTSQSGGHDILRGRFLPVISIGIEGTIVIDDPHRIAQLAILKKDVRSGDIVSYRTNFSQEPLPSGITEYPANINGFKVRYEEVGEEQDGCFGSRPVKSKVLKICSGPLVGKEYTND